MPVHVPARTRATPPRLRHGLALAAFWTVYVGGELRAVGLTALAVLTVVASSQSLRTGVGWWLRPMGVLRFAPLLLWLSLAGATDVAFRALRRRPHLAPQWMTFRLRLAAGTPAASLFAALVGVLPGALCARTDGHRLWLHVLDPHQPHEARFRRLEDTVGAMFGVVLPLWGGADP